MLGNPTNPTSARVFNSRYIIFFSPYSPIFYYSDILGCFLLPFPLAPPKAPIKVFCFSSKSFKNTFGKTVLEILDEVLKVHLISQIKTARVESIRVYSLTQREGSQSSCESILTGEVVVVIEVVDTLGMAHSEKIDITYFGGPFEVIMRRPNILILIPSPTNQSPSQIMITTFNNENFLIVTYPIPFFPCLKIHNILSFLIFLFLYFFIILYIFILFGRGTCI